VLRLPQVQEPARPDDSPAPSGGAVSSFLAPGLDVRRESRRIAGGLIVLAFLSVVLLNFGIYQNARNQLTRQHWNQLQVNTEKRRDDVQALLDEYQRDARFVAGQAVVKAWARNSMTSPLAPSEQESFRAELDRIVRDFKLDFASLVSPEGTILVGNAGASRESAEDVARLTHRALSAGVPTLGDLRRTSDGAEDLAVAVPIVDSGVGGRVPVLMIGACVDDATSPLLRNWPGFGQAAGAYLVRQDGDRVVFLTSLPSNPLVRRGSSVPGADPVHRGAAMAAVGAESRVEIPQPTGSDLWAVTRFLPEVGWGLVGQDDRRAIDEGMRSTLLGLLLLDLSTALLALGALWFWRRQYANGLAAREVELTKRHAARVQSVLDTALDAIVAIDHEGRILEFNPSAEKIFGHQREAVLGRDMAELLIPQAYRANHSEGLSHHLKTNESKVLGQRIERFAMRADGTEIPIEIAVSRMPNMDTPMFTAFIRDISERVEAEKRIRSIAEGLETSNRRLAEVNAQLDEASRLKSEFLANTSHELRTPLNGMIGFLQLVLDGMCDDPEEERDFLNQALQCSRHLLGLINDVLDIAKIEAGKLTLEIEPIDVQQLFDEVYTLTHVQAAQRGIALKIDPPASGELRARGDFGKVKQVLINLVGNSLKFTPQGTITLSATQHPDSGHFMFVVQDTGIGIAPERQKLVFEKFTQADGSTTRKYGGTGLGLAISRSLVELMGGIIGVHSDGEGKGSRMYFSLPVWNDQAQSEVGPDEPTDRIDGPAGGPLVMVVEDDRIFRKYLTTLLHQNGYRTVETRHAEGGWVLARRLCPSVVVLDYALGCNEGANLRTGWDLAERMTTDSTTRHIPLIFVTGFDDELRDKLKATAFARRPQHLMKPIDGSVLLEKIQELVGQLHSRTVRVLMADDDPMVGAFIRKVLPEKRYHLQIAAGGEECLHFLRTQPRGFDLLLLDLMMPKVSGYDVLREMTLTGTSPELPVVVLTNFPEARTAEEKRLLEDGLVLDVLPKSSIHDNPKLLPHLIDWQMHVSREDGAAGPKPGLRDDTPGEKAA
jgi:PAS domain S-box-containing protein